MHATVLIIVLALCSYFTAVISGLVGMAGGIVLLSIMTFFLPLKVIIPVHGLVQLVSNSYRTILLRSYVNRAIFKWFCVGLPAGAFLAIFVIKKIENESLPLFLVAMIILYAIFRPKKMPALKIPIPAFALIGLGVGFLGPLIGATGPFMAPFFLREDLSKEEIVASKAAVQTVGHLIKIPTFLYLGFAYFEYAPLIICMALAVILGTRTGVYFLGKISQFSFNRIFKFVLFFAALRVLYKATAPLLH